MEGDVVQSFRFVVNAGCCWVSHSGLLPFYITFVFQNGRNMTRGCGNPWALNGTGIIIMICDLLEAVQGATGTQKLRTKLGVNGTCAMCKPECAASARSMQKVGHNNLCSSQGSDVQIFRRSDSGLIVVEVSQLT